MYVEDLKNDFYEYLSGKVRNLKFLFLIACVKTIVFNSRPPLIFPRFIDFFCVFINNVT